MEESESLFVKMKEENDRLKEENRILNQQNRNMKEVLKFYGNQRMYMKHTIERGKVIAPVLLDSGKKAREAQRGNKIISGS